MGSRKYPLVQHARTKWPQFLLLRIQGYTSSLGSHEVAGQQLATPAPESALSHHLVRYRRRGVATVLFLDFESAHFNHRSPTSIQEIQLRFLTRCDARKLPQTRRAKPARLR
eukprot:scaffold467_cov366-Pavlova_lutheri.AAC.20